MAGRGILKNTFTVGGFTALSRVMGLVREMLQSRLVGAGVHQSAFTLAFAIPNMARKMFGEGALTAAFVPVFKGELENSSREEAARLARRVMTMVVLMLSAAALLAIASLDVLQRFPAFFGIEAGERFMLTIDLVKTLLPYMVFICAAAFGMGVLNSMGRFMASSFMPCLLNICWIGVLVFIWAAGPSAPSARIRIVSMAILAAGALQMFFMFWMMARRGVSPRLSFSGWRGEKTRLVWRNMAIGAVGAGAVQINYMLDQFLAQIASPWAAGVVGYAERLMDLPLGVVGVAFGTVLLPAFSGHFAKNDPAGAKQAFTDSLSSMLYVMIPAGFGLAVLARETTAAIYQGGEFGTLATIRVSRAVAVYSAGLVFFGVQKILVPWFQAQGDMKTPLRVSLATIALNATLNIAAVAFLPVEFKHVGLAASTVVCAGAGMSALYVLAVKRNGSFGACRLVGRLAGYALAAAAMSAVVVAARPFASKIGLVAGSAAAPFASIGFLAVLGVAFYVSATRPGILLRLFRKDKARTGWLTK